MESLRRYLLFILAVSLLLTKSLYSSSWEFYYLNNKAALTAEKCENKSLPEMKCHGRCYLAKQLDLQKDNSSPISKTINVDIWKTADYICCIQVESNKKFIPISKENLVDLKDYSLIINDLNSIFHPPCIA